MQLVNNFISVLSVKGSLEHSSTIYHRNGRHMNVFSCQDLRCFFENEETVALTCAICK